MTLWLDFFLQAFVTAFAWIAAAFTWAIVLVLGRLGRIEGAVRPAVPEGPMSSEVILLIRANALLFSRAEVLADFEIETIRAAHDRRVLGGGSVTEAELRVVRDALDAMLAAPRQDLTDADLAA